MPRLAVPDVVLRTLGRQLGSPSGPLGAVVARMLNKGNRSVIAAAVDALEPRGADQVADIGFGGGVGLQLLLDATGPDGRVHGVEPSKDMIRRATRRYRELISSGRLTLHEAGMEALPLPDGALNGWISLNTVYFVQDLAPAFAELRRVLSREGKGVLGVADPDWMARQSFARHGFTVRPVDYVVAELTAAGLQVETRRLAGEDPYHLLVCRPTQATGQQ
jgi:arsenite methyltransferase